MTHKNIMETWTKEGRDKRLEQLVEQYKKSRNLVGLVRLIGGSIDDFRSVDSGSHPDERGENHGE